MTTIVEQEDLEPLPGSVLGPSLPTVPEHHPFRQEVRAWLRVHAPRRPEPLEARAQFDHRRMWQRTMHAGGWAAPSWPVAVGGRGAGPLEEFMFYEELALAGAPHLANQPGVILLGPTLMRWGTPDQQARFLPGIVSGRDIWCQGFSEPDAGSDLASIRTRAHLDGDSWVITGHKVWITWAGFADWCFVLCRTEPTEVNHRGLSMLVCEMGQPGITTRPIHQMSGASEFGEVYFDGARTPRHNIVGEPGQGWSVAMTVLEFERSDQSFTDHARLLVDLRRIVVRLRSLAAVGQLRDGAAHLARGQAAALWSRAQHLRHLNLQVAQRRQHGDAVGATGSLVKLAWSELVQDVAALGLAIEGIGGLANGAGSGLLASRAVSIYSGTSEIQRNLIAERLLGLPR